MSKSLTEQKVLKKLGIPDFRHLTKDKVISMASKSMMDKMDPEVAKKIIEQFPNFSDTMKDILHECREWLDNALQSNEDSVKSVYSTCDNIINSLQDELKNDNLSFEERKYIFDKMIEVLKIKSEKDSENKCFIAVMAFLGTVAAGLGIAGLLSALGGDTEIETEHDDLDDDDIVYYDE